MATTTKAKSRFKKLVVPVPILAKNAAKPADVRKKKAEREFKQLVFPRLRNHELWDITSINWKGPVKPQMKKYLMTVGLKRNKKEGPPSSDPKVTTPTTPPPSA
ncbi:MAG TPA: hypothetical protein VGQ53_02500 [Chitinophagaceae bacterium]|jgi:hypothetical protein|nr:hypothetical protein [Chitinophagaceae bacterium]